jgi:RNA polymerase sigma factor (sigma-70 family)
MNRGAANFGRVYEEHVWRVYGFLAYHMHDRHLAEDLTQTTFERALRAWSRFDPQRSSETTWLLAIARNALIDHYRRRRPERLEPEELLTASVPGPEEQLGTSVELTAALAHLSDRDREVVALRFGGDLTGPEIASLLELTLSNVQQILSRSLRKLRVLLEKEEPIRSSVQ